jgi:hypothetical protein
MATAKPKVEKAPVNMNTIRGLFGLAPHSNAYRDGKAQPITAADPQLLYGVELEIERANADWVIPGMTMTPDNSLRYGGLEYITVPMSVSVLNSVLERFFERAKVTEYNYSERCSVHVHANCHDLTLDQLATVVLLYQTFERLLYRFVGAERDKNIFCVPWHETQLTWSIINDLKEGVKAFHTFKRWQKYTGLNLLPLTGYGTIEFRQMPGTGDRKKIIDWCNIIGCLFAYARNNDLESTKKHVVDLNTTSEYKNMLDRVFRDWADLLRVPLYEEVLEEGVLNTKYSLMEKKVTEVKTPGVFDLHAALIEHDRQRARLQVDVEAPAATLTTNLSLAQRIARDRASMFLNNVAAIPPIITTAGRERPLDIWDDYIEQDNQ